MSEMKAYIGTKQINAMPMNRQAYNDFRGWELPADEDGTDEGFLVEYVDGGEANTDQFNGYASWSPKEVFERAYNSSGEMTFGDAVALMKSGYKVARAGWNGKGMWIAQGAGCEALPADSFWNRHTRQFAIDNGGAADVLPYFLMKTADDKILMGWLASQSDMQAEDWGIVE